MLGGKTGEQMGRKKQGGVYMLVRATKKRGENDSWMWGEEKKTLQYIYSIKQIAVIKDRGTVCVGKDEWNR